MSNKTIKLPEHVETMLSALDAQRGFPAGTLASVVQQETGGKLAQFLEDPSKYHYAPNARGKRIAPHTGKESTAFGPFGILESTARDPGWGVKPLQNKSFEEQARFAADYLAARAGQAGSLVKGLAGYGEGDRYAKQVAGRVEPPGQVEYGRGEAVAAAEPPAQAVGQPAANRPVAFTFDMPIGKAAKAEGGGKNPWTTFLGALASAKQVAEETVDQIPLFDPRSLAFGKAAMPQVNTRVDFTPFGFLGRK